MATIEQSVKAQFARVFVSSDWRLFKKMAESNLREAATLRNSDMSIESSLKLLARNSRKRLLIGVGVELLLKAIYLRKGYVINTLLHPGRLKFPISAKDAVGVELVADRTFKFNEFIEKLPEVVVLRNSDLTLKGLRVAKVFRNKEGHVVTKDHAFDPSNYRDIAVALEQLYQDAFDEKLSLRFSVAKNEDAVWRISS